MKESNTIYNYILNSFKDAFCLFLRILFIEKNYQEVVERITRSYLNKLNHHDLYLNLLLIQAYLNLSDEKKDYFKRASDMVKRLLARNAKNVYLANEAAILLKITNKSQSSLYVLKKIRENTLNFVSCCLNTAIVYILNEQYNEAVSLLLTVLHQSSSPDSSLLNLLAFVEMKLHLYKDSLLHLSKALLHDPSDVSIWHNMVIVHLANAKHILSQVRYYHETIVDPSTNCYPCCGAKANEPGCKCKSLRNPGDLVRAEASIQFALSTLASFQKNGVAVEDVESLLIECKNLWTEKETQKEVDAETERIQKDIQASLLTPSTNDQTINSSVLEKEREEQLRIERIVQEERMRLQGSMVMINNQEKEHEGPKPRKKKQQPRVTISNTRQRNDDERVVSSDDDTDDAGEEDDFATKNIFGDDDDDEEEEDTTTKKRKRAVESSDDEEKRPHLDDAALQKEVDDVFSDDD